MTFHDNPDPNRPLEPRVEPAISPYDPGWSAGSIILGCLAFVAVVFSIFYMMADPNPNTASRADRPVVTTNTPVTTPTTTPAQPRATETTGSGASIPPAPTPLNR